MNDCHLTPEPKKTTTSSSRSSTSGEEGFISGGSLNEDQFDRIAYQISSLNVKDNNSGYASYLNGSIEEFANNILSSDRSEDQIMAAITTQQQQAYHLNTNYNNMKPFGQSNSANLSVTNYNTALRMNNGSQQQQYSSTPASSISSNNGQHVPGSWYFTDEPIGAIDDTGSGAASTGIPGDCSPIADFGGEQTAIQHVEVPSSEHVAEIVGRQGCKIKALRNKTGTYIRSPPRGEDPIFTITGRLEDVMEAKREIECAADHFTQIRASRRHSQGGMPAPGHITAYVRVPLRLVGLVVGPKGQTIKRIQQNHHVYIITPSREREPIFEVTGLPHNVDAARRDIEQHIFQRTGNMPITDATSIQNYEMATAALQASRQFGQPVRQLNNCYGDYRNEAAMYGMRNGYKTYSSSGSPPPPYYDQMNPMYRMPQVNNENVFNNGWQQQQNNYNSQCENRYFGNEYSGIQRANNFGSTGAYLSNTTNYLNNLTSSIPRDEGIGESPTNSLTKIGPDHPLRLISSLWNDLDTSDAHDKAPVESGPAPQLATA